MPWTSALHRRCCCAATSPPLPARRRRRRLQPAAEVPESMLGTQELKDLVQTMIDTMRAAPGVGLAAPQIGVALQARSGGGGLGRCLLGFVSKGHGCVPLAGCCAVHKSGACVLHAGHCAGGPRGVLGM